MTKSKEEGRKSKASKVKIPKNRSEPTDDNKADEAKEQTDNNGRDIDDEIMVMEEEIVANTFDPIPFPGRWNVETYMNQIAIRIVNKSPDMMDLDFDLVNVEAPIANALRRILIAEVPTMAIEKVFLYQNTSCIQDEVLCHRLGLIPIKADPTKFAFPLSNSNLAQQQPTMNTDVLDEEPPGEPKRNLIFELNIVCPNGKEEKGKKKKEKGGKTGMNLIGGGSDGEDCCVKEPDNSGNWVLYTSAFKWIPIGDQQKEFQQNPPQLVHKDIILAKMRPGQEIEARCHCVKGIGRDHAKFSPVATATYRMLPQIKLKRDDFDEDQMARLQSSFSNGVIGKDERTGRAYVKDARADTSSRNIFMHDDLKDAVEMSKKKTHFIFSVESTGAMPANKLVWEACEIMKKKVESLRKNITNKLNTIPQL